MNGSPKVSEDSRKKIRVWSAESYVDVGMMIALLIILVMGLVMIYSTSSYRANELYGDNWYFFKRQTIYMLAAVCVMIAISRYDYRMLLPVSKGILFSSMALQILVLVMGTASHGSARWLYIGSVGFQPSEYAKTAIIIYTAAQASMRSRELARPSVLLKVMALPLITIVLIGVENLSTAIICFAILFIVLFVGSPTVRHFVIIGLCGIAGGGLFIAFAGYRANRVKIWLAPEKYDDGYQTIQSLYAVGSGGLFGRGLGNSVQKMGFIPESHNDMIFSVICEELGIVGAVFVIVLFLVLLCRMALIAMNSRDRFGGLLVSGVMAHVAVQMLINVSVVTNTIPPTGVPMPLISYGGSSIIFILIEMGIVMSVAHGCVAAEEK
ncbi:MAG: putative peptidoglycan glycosyltransferase FtsW [Clostridiales bacterium]|nr:putative peptidoglycan glycosyltransferase FtsW [Clostridiales bacterium]